MPDGAIEDACDKMTATSLPLKKVTLPTTMQNKLACPTKPVPRHKPRRLKIPKPPGATVQMKHANGREPELLRHRAMLDAVRRVTFPYPAGRFEGRGIVICRGGEKYLPSVYVLVRLLRHLRCRLPIEVWHLGREEMPDAMRSLLAEQGAVCMDGMAMRRVHPARRLGGWELKCYALLHSTFAEVLLLDADKLSGRRVMRWAQMSFDSVGGAGVRPANGFLSLSRLCEIRGIGLPAAPRVFMMLLPCAPRFTGFGMARSLTRS